MRVFEEMNTSKGDVCPICKTSKPGKIFLMPIISTEDNRIMEAQQTHISCMEIATGYYVRALDSERR